MCSGVQCGTYLVGNVLSQNHTEFKVVPAHFEICAHSFSIINWGCAICAGLFL